MEILELMRRRHSVRQYTTQPIEEEKREILNALIAECNERSGLHMQIFYDEPKCFSGAMAHYGSFRNVNNYIAVVGPKTETADETGGYYGEKVVLKAQEIGLNTCWVALTRGKSAAVTAKNEKVICIIAIGYGENQGTAHKNKPLSALCNCADAMPDWFARGMEGALLAPTAVNQQKFYVTLKDGKASITAGRGFYTKLDLGIVKYHFEAASLSE